MKEIDARGLSCPAPVLRTRAVIEDENPGAVRVLVDNAAAQQNVQRFLTSAGYQTSLKEEGGDFLIDGQADENAVCQVEKTGQETADRQKILVMCATDRVGFGDDKLGRKLMVSFIATLKEMGPELWRLVFVNNGVKLTVEESPVLAALTEYEENGIQIMVCGACLNYYGLLDKKKVGQTTNMLDIVTALQAADKVINL